MGLYDDILGTSTSIKPLAAGHLYDDILSGPNSTPPPISGAMNFPTSTDVSSNSAFAPVQNNSSGERIFSGIGNTISGAISSWLSSAQALPGQLANDVESALPDFQKANTAIINHSSGISFSDGLAHVFTGIAKAGGRSALDVAGLIFAPISAAIGTTLQNSGLQTLQDNSGQTIATTSGIIDLPAFQNFAMQHPNAGADFNRILTGFLSIGGGGEEVGPKKIATDIKSLADNLVNSAKGKPPVENAPPELPVRPSGPTSLMKIPSPEGTIALSGVETPPAPTESPVAPEPVPGIGEPATPAQTPRIESTATPSPVAEPTSPIPEGAPLSPIASPETPSVTLAEPATSGQIVSTPESRAEAINKPITTGNAPVESQSVTIDNMQQHLSPADFETFKQDTSHEQAKKVEQVQKAQAFVSENPAVADKIIFEGAHPPEGLRTQDVFTEALIKAQADYKAGKIPFEQYYKYVKADELIGSRHGSELGSRANRFEKDNPASWLTKAREAVQKSNIKYKEGETPAKTSKSAVAKEAKTAKATVSKARAKLIDYQKIIDTITC